MSVVGCYRNPKHTVLYCTDFKLDSNTLPSTLQHTLRKVRVASKELPRFAIHCSFCFSSEAVDFDCISLVVLKLWRSQMLRRNVAALQRSRLPAACLQQPFSSAPEGVTEHLRLSRKQAERHDKDSKLILGSVCYAESISSIWKGMMRHFARQGLDVDFVLYTNYERLVDALFKKDIDIAWNGPLAHARTVRLAQDRGLTVAPLGMRDVDRDFRTYVIVPEKGDIHSVSDLSGRRIAAGTVDSPQAYVMPLASIGRQGVPLDSLTLLRYDRDIGKHGDTAYGEDAVLDSLLTGRAEAGFVSSLMWERAVSKGGPAAAGLRALPAHSIPPYDHCQFDALHLPHRTQLKFQRALLAQRSDGSSHWEDVGTMKLEGIAKEWLPARGGAIEEDTAKPTPDARVGYEGMLDALDLFGEPPVRWPGILHSSKRHPVRTTHAHKGGGLRECICLTLPPSLPPSSPHPRCSSRTCSWTTPSSVTP